MLQCDDRVGQFLALGQERCGQLLAVAFERPPRLPGSLPLIGKGLWIPLGPLDILQLVQVLLPRLAIVVGVEPDVGPALALIENGPRLGLLVVGRTRNGSPIWSTVSLQPDLRVVRSSSARPSASGSMPRNTGASGPTEFLK